MGPSITFALVASMAVAPIETQWQQVAGQCDAPKLDRAIVLIQGYRPHPFTNRNIGKAEWQGWQLPESELVKGLADDGDVFAFAYAQNVAVNRIAELDDFAGNIQRLKQAGYREIVLVGYSAGGLIARQFVEDQPDSGVTKVVQVCTPNGGASLAGVRSVVRRHQREFLESVSKGGRQRCLTERCDKRIPDHVEFVCVVGHQELNVNVNVKISNKVNVAVAAKAQGDGVVSTDRQWTADLQEQGIPAVVLHVDHLRVLYLADGIEAIGRLVKEKQNRWSAEQINEMKSKLRE